MYLRTRLALIAAGLTLAGLGLGLVLLYVLLERSRLADLDRELAFQAKTILNAALTDPNNEITPELEDELTLQSGVSSMLVFREGRLIFAGGALNTNDSLDPATLPRGNGVSSVGGWRVHTLSRSGLTVQVGRPLATLSRGLNRYVAVALPLALTLGLLAGGTAWLLVGLALKPLEALTEATSHFEEGAEVPEPPNNDEVSTLSRSFRDLLARLRLQREREQRFLTYAAHELRTPISAFRASLEAAQFRGQLDAPQIERLHREALRLETLAQNLLALSRAESGEVRVQPLDLADLLSEAFDRFQPLALERGMELELNANPAPTQADPRLLEQALNNLVINALRYAKVGFIRLSSGTEGGWAWLEVADNGPGFPKTITEGLGLRVAYTVARALGGRFSTASADGARARLELPAESPQKPGSVLGQWGG
ncbi:HAMP domain-containing sensor histidine kinase [Meiothermus granaticius]|uniref:histidine kinase n=1 Tax=Meiothermus granaticius NBRC 107808 TaxID=1227551 RepID=A0A399F8V4_9DEIN|nr:HAMP domain-containing sensor histidine kinase [Meiothermus granaticius]RIH92125.1 Osmolarity sensor protein EnvZ [Meiothermus granaticius NBRC 107808]GEM86260.1 two-component sensor histidine kinase [Meiothermus granaticius NBRC 107808]